MANLKFAAKRNMYGLLFILPGILALIIMMVYPVLQTFAFSFSKIKLPGFDLEFIGLKNFITTFSKAEVPIIIKNTIKWTVGLVFLRLFFGMITALIMNSEVPGIKVIRIIVLIPWTIPIIVSANTWRWILQGDFGVLNGMLKAWGFAPYSWLANANSAMSAILVAATWAGYPFVMMMILSAIQGLPKEYFEAAMVDGANFMQKFWHIIIPSIKPVLFILIALETMNAINSFDMIFTMTGGGPGFATEIFGLFVYHLGFTYLNFAGASSVSVVLIMITLLLFITYSVLQKVNKKRYTI